MLFKNGINLQNSLCEYIEQTQRLVIFTPYIKIDTLKHLLGNSNNVKSIFVRWEARDLVLGSSDLEIYPYLRDKGITLYRNPRLHLKAYVDNFSSCFLTTANISARALNVPEFPNYNYEIGTIVENLDLDDRLYFNIIENESILITDSIYKQLLEQLPEKKKRFPDEDDFSIKIEAPDKNFLISSLPMTYSIETLCRIYEDGEYINDVELNCAIHDLALYKIPFGLPPIEFKQRLVDSFFLHPFIKTFLGYIEQNNNEIYFGTAKEWIHKNCADVPTPRRWEITENIQILYRWIVKLGNGKYIIDVPGARSERLSIAIVA